MSERISNIKGENRESVNLKATKELKLWSYPVLSVPVVGIIKDHTPNYEGRTFAHGGVLIVGNLAPSERASNEILRPNLTTIEVGKYKNGDWNLLHRLDDNSDERIILEGKPYKYIDREGTKVGVVKRLVQQKRIKSMITHVQYPELVELAETCLVNYEEDYEVYDRLTTKSGLNSSLESFSELHPQSPFGKFGNNFRSIKEAQKHIREVHQFGYNAYVKFDRDSLGLINAGGIGHQTIPLGTEDQEIQNRLRVGISSEYTSGVVQIEIPEHQVMSISSGMESGKRVIYEAHLQSQVGSMADGAKPLPDNIYGSYLLNTVWPWYKYFLDENGVTGKQNMNFLILPPKVHEISKTLYGKSNVGPIALIDLNYRGITGTMNAMAKYEEETGVTIDQTNFRSRGVRVNPFYAENPHFIWAEAEDLGLTIGPNGNYAIINTGTFRPPFDSDYYKTQMIISGTQHDPETLLDSLEERIQEHPTMKGLEEQKNRWCIVPIDKKVSHGATTIKEEIYYSKLLSQQMSNFVMIRNAKKHI